MFDIEEFAESIYNNTERPVDDCSCMRIDEFEDKYDLAFLAIQDLNCKRNEAEPKWNYSKKGTYQSKTALKYKASYTVTKDGGGTMYLLDNNLVLFATQQRRIINQNDADRIQSSEFPIDGIYHYIYSYDSKSWYEYMLPGGSQRSTADLDFLFKGFWEGAKLVGRYATPLEDIVILIDGRDFDGEQANQVLAGGMLVVGLIPGGKVVTLAKPLAKGVKAVAKSAEAWHLIIKWGGTNYKLPYKVVNSVITFGDRSQLKRILKTASNIEAHHIIPWTKGGKHKVVQAAARAGFHLNMVQNGLGLKKFTKLIGEGLHGNHPAYDNYIVNKLEAFAKANPNFTPEQAKAYLLDSLIPELKTLITFAKNSGKNLNEYFKTL